MSGIKDNSENIIKPKRKAGRPKSKKKSVSSKVKKKNVKPRGRPKRTDPLIKVIKKKRRTITLEATRYKKINKKKDEQEIKEDTSMEVQENIIEKNSSDTEDIHERIFSRKNFEIYKKICTPASNSYKISLDQGIEKQNLENEKKSEKINLNSKKVQNLENEKNSEINSNSKRLKIKNSNRKKVNSEKNSNSRKVQNKNDNECSECSSFKLNSEKHKCKNCSKKIHNSCTYNPFCKECRDKIYMTNDSETFNRLECHPFSSLIKKRKFLTDTVIPHYEFKESFIKKLYVDKKLLSPKYFSPFTNLKETIFICQICFSHFTDKISLQRHKLKCDGIFKGNLVYKKDKYKIYEVDGEFDTLMCRSLCLLAKCFLDHKTLYYDVEPFLFYLLYEKENFIGYFSREKYSNLYNLSCIVVLPCYQGKGFGYFLIDFSYRLFQIFQRKGTPEKPLSEQGLAVYKKYWKFKVYEFLKLQNEFISIQTIAKSLAMTNSDVLMGLEMLEFIKKEGEDYKLVITDKIFLELMVCDRSAIKYENIRYFKELDDGVSEKIDEKSA